MPAFINMVMGTSLSPPDSEELEEEELELVLEEDDPDDEELELDELDEEPEEDDEEEDADELGGSVERVFSLEVTIVVVVLWEAGWDATVVDLSC